MYLIKQVVTYLILILILLIPALIWAYFSIPAPTFVSFPDGIRSLGQLAGILGANMFALNFIISARFKLVEDFLSGLNHVYFVHHSIGATALILLLLHPILLSLQILPVSVEAVSAYLFPIITDYPVWFGITALTILIIILFVTLYMTNVEYQKWRFIHQLLGASIFFASLHIYFIPGNLSSNPYLKIYMITVCFSATVIFIFKTALARFFIKHYSYKVISIDTKGNDILEICSETTEKEIKYLPGQFVFVEFVDSKGIRREPHPFSISTPPGSNKLGFSVKSLGDFTETLKLLKPESKVLIEGPYGRFLFSRACKKQIWIAGGIGITPFLSMARGLISSTEYLVNLFYVTVSKDEAVYEKELLKISDSIHQFTLHLVYSKESGHLNADEVSKKVPDFKSRDIFLCGPPLMMKDLRNQFRKLGCKNYRIHSEEFALR